MINSLRRRRTHILKMAVNVVARKGGLKEEDKGRGKMIGASVGNAGYSDMVSFDCEPWTFQ